MEIIALLGNSNVGKSETINFAYQLMLQNGYRQVTGNFKKLDNPIMRDFIDVLG
jgi:ribosome biogenesis GTPase A